MKTLIFRRIPAFLLCIVLLTGLSCFPAMAAVSWPDSIEISAEGGILMDADTGTILYGKNIHNTYYPASITKILTALIVIENCDLDETVTFSRDAVFNVEAGSSSAALDVGDQLSVRDCLYAMVLKSANEAANALAEHTAGSISAFADMMNEKAASLGCTDSHFNNPSGLNDPEHYTSAYDMALIAQAAFNNKTFIEIDSTLYYDLPQTKRNPDGLRIYPGHRMLKKNSTQYYEGIIGGKTGYTSLAGNTLVTCAERNGLKLITVVLNGHQTHYTDTRALLNFGYHNFVSVNAADIDTKYAEVDNDMTIAGLSTTDLSVLQLKGTNRLVLPANADYSEITSSISYELPDYAPEDAVAEISYQYGTHPIGSSWLVVNEHGADATEPAIEVTSAETLAARIAESLDETTTHSEKTSPFELALPQIHIPAKLLIALAVIIVLSAVFAIVICLKYKIEKKEESDRITRHNRRKERLKDIGVSSSEFDLLLEQKRSSSSAPRDENRKNKKKKFRR
jgi:D-alanyl-D-alanine carboxypeptidase